MKIVTLTMNPTIDMNSRVQQVVPERKLRCEEPRYEPGGGGINVSRAIKKLGGQSKAYYPAGGTNGDFLQQLLDEEQVNQHPISIQGLTRENVIIFEESGHQQFRFGMPGPEMAKNEWQTCLDMIAHLKDKPDFIVGSGSLPQGVPTDFYARLSETAKQIGSRAIIDTSDEPLSKAVEEGVYLIKPNMRELKDILGQDIKEENQLKQVAQEMINKKQTEVVVVSLGAGGAFVACKDWAEHLRSPTVPIKSKVGAGDSMMAGIVLSLSDGKSIKESVKFGIAAGAAAVMTPGTELCRKEDTENLYKGME